METKLLSGVQTEAADYLGIGPHLDRMLPGGCPIRNVVHFLLALCDHQRKTFASKVFTYCEIGFGNGSGIVAAVHSRVANAERVDRFAGVGFDAAPGGGALPPALPHGGSFADALPRADRNIRYFGGRSTRFALFCDCADRHPIEGAANRARLFAGDAVNVVYVRNGLNRRSFIHWQNHVAPGGFMVFDYDSNEGDAFIDEESDAYLDGFDVVGPVSGGQTLFVLRKKAGPKC